MSDEAEASSRVAGTGARVRNAWKGLLFIVVAVALLASVIAYVHTRPAYRERMYRSVITSCHAHQGTWVPAPPPAQFEGHCI